MHSTRAKTHAHPQACGTRYRFAPPVSELKMTFMESVTSGIGLARACSFFVESAAVFSACWLDAHYQTAFSFFHRAADGEHTAERRHGMSTPRRRDERSDRLCMRVFITSMPRKGSAGHLAHFLLRALHPYHPAI